MRNLKNTKIPLTGVSTYRKPMRMIYKTPTLVISIAAIAASLLNADMVSFGPDSSMTVSGSAWQVGEVFLNSAAQDDGIFVENTTNGNPGDDLQLNLDFTDLPGGNATARATFINASWSYNPSVSGELNEFSYTVDFVGAQTGGAVRLGLTQGGNTYMSDTDLGSVTTSYGTFSASSIVASNFTLIDATSGTPDFSVSGGEILFGFIVGRGTTGDGAKSFDYRFDNAGITLTTTAIPEPSTYAMIAGILAIGIACYRRRKS